MQIVDVQMPMKNFYLVEINVKNQHALMTSQLQHVQLFVKDGVNVKLDMSVLQMGNVSDKNFVHQELIVPQMNIGTFVVVAKTTCPQVCEARCECMAGFVRKGNDCVKATDCEANCPANEEFLACGSACRVSNQRLLA